MAIPSQPFNPPPDPELSSHPYPWNYKDGDFEDVEDRENWWRGAQVYGAVLCVGAVLDGLSGQPTAGSSGIVLIVLGFLAAFALTPLLYVLFQSGSAVGSLFAGATLIATGFVMSSGSTPNLDLTLASLAVVGLALLLVGELRAMHFRKILDSTDMA
jgi:hypothetical protein